MREALVVAHVVECFERRDARLQDAQRHRRLDDAALLEELDILAEQAVQRLLARDGDAGAFAE